LPGQATSIKLPPSKHSGAPDWVNLSDVDPALAAATRAALWEELEGGGHPFTAAHFPGLEFGRLLRGRGRRFVAAG
jgi:hypothetical protein